MQMTCVFCFVPPPGGRCSHSCIDRMTVQAKVLPSLSSPMRFSDAISHVNTPPRINLDPIWSNAARPALSQSSSGSVPTRAGAGLCSRVALTQRRLLQSTRHQSEALNRIRGSLEVPGNPRLFLFVHFLSFLSCSEAKRGALEIAGAHAQ